MIVLKKLIFGLIFLLVFAFTVYQLVPIFKSYDFIFSLSLQTLIQLISISALILASSFFFVLFATFAMDLKFVLPVGILASLIPFLFLTSASAVVLMVGIVASLLLTFLNLENTMKTYFTFQPNSLFGPAIRQLSSLIVLIICIIYFFSVNTQVQQNSFQIPDSLIDTALNLTNQQSSNQLIQLPQDLIKQAIKDQVQAFIKPYLSFVPLVLTVLLFLTLQSLVSILNLFIYPLLWIIFYILEKTGFIKFTEETRVVKKLILS